MQKDHREYMSWGRILVKETYTAEIIFLKECSKLRGHIKSKTAQTVEKAREWSIHNPNQPSIC